MELTLQDLMREIKQLRVDVDMLKENISGKDDGELNAGEHLLIDNAMREYGAGEVVGLEEIQMKRKNAGLEI